MTLRVAELETVFTADTSQFETSAKAVAQATKALDGASARPDIVADATDALNRITSLRAELADVDHTRTEAEITADAADAIAKVRDVLDRLDDVDGSDTTAAIRADVAKALQQFDDVDKQIAEVDGSTATATIVVDEKQAAAGLGRAGEMTGEFRDEAMQNFSEVTSSFAGDMQSVGDLVQGTLGGLASGIGGPLGIALGAAAVGVGALITKFSDAAAEAEELVTATADLANEIVDAGGALEQADYAKRFREWSAEIADSANWFERLVGLQEESTTNLDELREAADKAGVSVEDLVWAMSSGDVDAQDKRLTHYRDTMADLTAEIDANTKAAREHATMAEDGSLIYDATGEAILRQNDALEKQRDGLKYVTDELDRNVEQQREATERADMLAAAAEGVSVAELNMQRALDKANGALEEQGGKARDVKQAQLDLADQIDETTRVMTETDEKTGQLVSTERDREQALLDLASQIAETAAAQEDASGKTEDYNAVIGANRQAFEDAATAAGMTKEAAAALADQYGLVQKEVVTTFKAPGLDYVLSQANALNQKYRGIQHYATGLGGAGGLTMADGGVLESHHAQIAPAGAWRIWAEDETGGEAYIPLSPSKRSRSVEILADVAARFGADLHFPAGDVALAAGGPVRRGVGPTIRVTPREFHL